MGGPIATQAKNRIHLGLAIVVAGIWLVSQLNGKAVGQTAADLRADVEFEQAFYVGLRNRQLYRQAEYSCQKTLKQPDLNPSLRTALIIELLKTQAASASNAAGDDQAARWKASEASASSYLASEKQQPRQILIQVQAALLPLTRANRTLLEREFRGEVPEQPDQTSLSRLRESIRRLRNCLVSIEQLKALRLRQPPRDPHSLTVKQLQALEKNVKFEMAGCNLSRALFYPPNDRINRLDTLTQVLEQLNEVGTQLTSDDALWFDVKLRLAEAHRLLKQFNETRTILDQLVRRDWNTLQMEKLFHQQIQLALDLGNARKLAQRLTNDQRELHVYAPLDVSRVRAALEIAAEESQSESKKQWQEFAVSLAEKIKRNHGTYWGRIADLMIIEIARERSLPSNVQVLLRLADQFQRGGKNDQALETLDVAYEAALASENDKLAFSIGYRAATLVQKSKQHQLAAERMRLLANRFADHPSAANTHLLGCWNQSQVARESRTHWELYYRMLNELLRQWPATDEADRARTWLAPLLMQQKKYIEAFQLISDLPADRPIFEQNLPLLSQLAILAVTTDKRNPTLQSVRSKLARLHQELLDSRNQKPETGFQIQKIRAQLELLPGGNLLQVEAWMSDQLKRSDLSADSRTEARFWLIMAISQQADRQDEVNALLEKLAIRKESLSIWKKTLDSVDSRFQSDSISRLKAKITEKVLATSLSKPQKLSWQLLRARSLIASGSPSQAIELLESLKESNPENFSIQLELARSYSQAMQKKNVAAVGEKALLEWRRIARRLKPQTEVWFEAKWNVASLLHQTGKSDQAVKLIRYMEATNANWEQHPWRLRFENLMQRIADEN